MTVSTTSCAGAAAPQAVWTGAEGNVIDRLRDKDSIVALSTDVLRWECEQSDCSAMVSVGRRGFGASSAGRVDIPLAAVTLLDALQMASMRIGDTMEVSAWSQCGSLRSPPQSLFVVVAGTVVKGSLVCSLAWMIQVIGLTPRRCLDGLCSTAATAHHRGGALQSSAWWTPAQRRLRHAVRL